MFGSNNDLGAALYKSWTEKQRCDEIEKLVAGYRSGLPVGVLLKMTETIAGSKKKGKKILKELLTEQERKGAINAAEGGMQPLVKDFLG